MVVESNSTQVLLRKRRREHVALGVAGLLLLVGVVAAAVVFLPNRNAAPETVSTLPAQVPKTEAAAPLAPAARQVAGRFVLTAVARKNLAETYDLVGPNLRGGLTRKEWLTGNIPVIPYPIQSLRLAPFKIDYSHKSDALIEVALLAEAGCRREVTDLLPDAQEDRPGREETLGGRRLGTQGLDVRPRGQRLVRVSAGR